MKILDIYASDSAPRRIIHACGAVIAALVISFVVVGVVAESRELLREGTSAFVSDAVMRVGFGACVALLSALPYVLLARAAKQPGPPRLFAIVSVLTFLAQLSLTVNALFFGKTSTAPIGVLFIPIYLCAAVLAIWCVAAIIRRVLVTRESR